MFHTFFGIGGLSLMNHPGLRSIDPAYALPVETVQRLKARQAGGAVQAESARGSARMAPPHTISAGSS